jgi:hypothetical protein
VKQSPLLTYLLLCSVSIAISAPCPALAEGESADVPTSDLNSQLNPVTVVTHVNTVSELTDVNPDSWAFQALKSMVERFGCIEGYPNRTFQGDKSLARYEFASALNACLSKINELIEAGSANKATKEDLVAIQRLQSEFSKELMTLTARVDALEVVEKKIDSKSFSTTVKLNTELATSVLLQGADPNQTIINGRGVQLFSGGAINTVVDARLRLNFVASSLITSGDTLRVALLGVTGDSGLFGTGFVDYSAGTGPAGTAGALGGASPSGRMPVFIGKAYYDFPVSIFGGDKNLRIRIGPQVQNIDIVGRNKYTADPNLNFSLRAFRLDPLYNEILTIAITSNIIGGHLSWTISRLAALRIFYGAATGGNAGTVSGTGNGAPFGGGGLFGGTTQITAELGITPSPSVDIGFGYSYINISSDSTGTGFIFGRDGAFGSGDADLTYSTTNVSNVGHSVFNFHIDWDITPEVAIFGRFSHDNASFFGRSNGPAIGGTLSANDWMVGFAFPNLLGKGNLLSVAYVQPININNVSTVGPIYGSGASATSFEQTFSTRSAIEGEIGLFYRFLLNDHIYITPEVYFITNPSNVNQSGITIGILKASVLF